jgi:hypothetical protein
MRLHPASAGFSFPPQSERAMSSRNYGVGMYLHQSKTFADDVDILQCRIVKTSELVRSARFLIAMQEFIKNFTRDSSGAWICITKAEFKGPNGRIQVAVGSRFTRGTNFMGVDLAEWLDQELRRETASAKARPTSHPASLTDRPPIA